MIHYLKTISIALAAVLFIACDPEDKTVAVTGIEITSTPDPLTLTLGGTSGKVEATVLPTDATDRSVSFSVAPEGIVSVAADGKVFAIAPGSATITAISGADATITESCDVTVYVSYAGTFSVAPETPAAYSLDNVEVSFTIEEGGATGQIEMMRVKFAERMPEMDITVPGVTLTEETNGYLLSCGEDGIVPLMAGGPFPDRTITELDGSITAQTLSLSFVCMNLPVSFTGARITE